MSVKLLTERHLDVAQASLSLHMSKCHIVGNNMSRLKCNTKVKESCKTNFHDSGFQLD